MQVPSKEEIIARVEKDVYYCRLLLERGYPEFYEAPFLIKVDFSERRTSHLGGLYDRKPGISMAGKWLTENYKAAARCKHPIVAKVLEYKSYQYDPVIGNAYIDNPHQGVFLYVAHEVSHACQRYMEFKCGLERSLPHGDYFKQIYRHLRLDINYKYLPNQVQAKAQYDELIKRAKQIEMAA